MINNDILRRIRYTFDFSDKKLKEIFLLAECSVTREQITAWLKREEDDGYINCTDIQFTAFLNGLINEKRGKIDHAQVEPEKRLTNNKIMMKLKIALNLKADDVIEIMDLSGFKISKHELSAFFRKETHKNYRVCKDQILRNFLNGMQLKYRKT
jgi:uncharacterized protein YehS (DUF1456 family)